MDTYWADSTGRRNCFRLEVALKLHKQVLDRSSRVDIGSRAWPKAPIESSMFALLLISAVFLSLGFLTGLFGGNVGGMPSLARNETTFSLCAFLIGVVVGQAVALFWVRRTRRTS
ncbi:CorA family divalent cation transporter [Celeribacter marinus]|uniref:CorA family divalent cation transporter n=1 Tax=Celeribacter marinus TaxID=1397108 RepID=UPI003F6CC72A